MCGKESASKQESASSEQGVRSNNKCYAATTNLMQICFSHSCQQQAAKAERAVSSEQRAESREQRAATRTVKRKRSEGERKRSEGPILRFSSSHLWNVFIRLLLVSSGASGRSFVFAIMVYLIVIFSTVST